MKFVVRKHRKSQLFKFWLAGDWSIAFKSTLHMIWKHLKLVVCFAKEDLHQDLLNVYLRKDCIQWLLHTQPIVSIFQKCIFFFTVFLAFQQSYGTNVTIKDAKTNKTCLFADLMANFSVSYQQKEKVSQDGLWRASCKVCLIRPSCIFMHF